jgi:hypothetical protein
MASSDEPQPFLTGTDVVSVNNTGAWAAILTKEKLTVDAKSGKVIKLNAADSGLGVLEFTSDRNQLYFGALDNANASDAAVGDTSGCTYTSFL